MLYVLSAVVTDEQGKRHVSNAQDSIAEGAWGAAVDELLALVRYCTPVVCCGRSAWRASSLHALHAYMVQDECMVKLQELFPDSELPRPKSLCSLQVRSR